MAIRFIESVLLAAFLTTLGYGLGRLLGYAEGVFGLG